MDLPIDHFRLLGVSPSAESDTVLRKLQSRCDSPPDQGFTHEALLQREELLRRSADLLTDPERRADYESALLDLSQTHPNDTVGLDLSPSAEVAGLILLWEANVAFEAFQIARQGLQPPQAPALGSGREADLTLLAALACRDAAADEQRQRHYEAAAHLLQEGIDLQQRMGKLPDQQTLLERDLDALRPYRILDLLSRDLGDRESHLLGLQLLDQLVIERGGLEGSDDPSAVIAGLSQQDFEPFFKQIRRFLTVEEQVDLFSGWRDQGSAEAGCLAVFALTAAGFSRRKPELLEQARDQLDLLMTEELLDPMPLMGCLDLLLGNVSAASTHFLAIRDPDLRAWLDQHPGDRLAAQCDYCRVWLERDVLPGYRDVRATDVDLDAWFADRDVQSYVDRLDRQQARRSETESVVADGLDEFPSSDFTTIFKDASTDAGRASIEPDPSEMQPHLSVPRPVLIAAAAGVAALGLIAALARFLPRLSAPSPQTAATAPQQAVESSQAVERSQAVEGSKTAEASPPAAQSPPAEPTLPIKADPAPSQPAATLQTASAAGAFTKPLTSETPSAAELQALIQAWLDRKAALLAGQASDTADLGMVARPRLVERVRNERAADADAALTQSIDASITAVDIVSRRPHRIEVSAQIAYADKTLNASGQTVNSTAPGALKVSYILGRDADQWRLHEYIPGS